jgi:hypothetical protein
MQNWFFKVLFLVCASFTFQTVLPAQDPETILTTAETKYMQEKLYLHTDKSTYTSGETIWFKAYLTADNLPAPMSKTVYAELLNDKGQVLQRKMMPIVVSGAFADFTIPDSLPDNRVFIRAYTAWMLNFDSSLLCIKPIYLIPKKGLPKKTAAPVIVTLNFFPEGGDLVENIESQVAFKATDQDGIPLSLKGEILNNKNKVISSFASVHDGMGVISLTPLPGETYKAVWKDKNGVIHEASLPETKKEGAVLSIAYPNNKLYYTIARQDSAKPEFTRFTVVAQTQQRMMYIAQINLTKKSKVTAPMPTDSMPDGVLQITLFNALMEPVAERLAFVNNNNYSFITDLHLIEKNIIKRGRNVIQLDVGGNLLTNLSVAVTDADINPVGKNESNIYTQLLLSSDLKGYVYNPAYYFSGDDDSIRQHLDLVMMTNGWRRFKWEKLLADQWPVLNYLPEKYLNIQGKVLGLSRTLLHNKAISGILKTKNSPPSFLNIPINDAGDFIQGEQYFFDTAKLYYQLSDDKDKSLTTMASFSFKNSFIKAPVLSKAQTATLYLPDLTDSSALSKSNNLATLRRTQQQAAKVETLQEVQIKSKQKSLKQKLDEEYTSGFFSGGDGYSFNTEEDPFARSSPGVLEYLQGKVAGLQITTNGNGSATWRGSATSFFLNEMPTDLSMLKSVNMNDVALIKVFQPPFFGATGGGSGGAIAVYTKKGSSLNSDFKALPFTNIYGYSAIREFYSPNYSNNSADPFVKDYRTTLYWNPHVYIDKNYRRITLPFFNSDNCKKIRVIVEGINELGVLTREEKIFE